MIKAASTKTMKVVGKAKKIQEQVIHGSMMDEVIMSGQATPAPPLGPHLGQRGLNVQQFCKEFNEKTKDYLEGVPLPCRIYINADRTYRLEIQTPMTSWLLKRAAGIRRAAMYPSREWAGRVTVKHIYEIAKIKATDDIMVGVSLESIAKQVVAIARRMGVEVVRDLDAADYRQFLEQRQQVVADQMKLLEEKKAAKLLRTPSVT